MSTQLTPSPDARSLCGGAVFLPGDDGYEAGRGAWQANVDQRPALLAYPADADEVADVVRLARDRGLRVAAQGTGHNAAPLGDLSDAVLVRTAGMNGVSVDPERRVARAAAGALWEDVVDVTAPHGLYPLHGSSPDVGVVGYSLGGGIGWAARRHGLQTNSLTAVELVTPQGRFLRADAEHHSELFWALRGGGGNFGVVTAVEFRLYPYRDAYAGMLLWDWSETERVLAGWLDWTRGAPDEVTTSLRILQVPDIEGPPELLRGRSVVAIDGAVMGLSDDDAAAIVAPLRAMAPEHDLWGPMPAAALVRLHGDPEEPTPAVSATRLLGALDGDAVAAFVGAAGPGSGSRLFGVELRQLGGALGRRQAGAGALELLAGDFALFAFTIAPTAEIAAAGQAEADRVSLAMAPWATGGQYLNFAESRVPTRMGYGDAAYARLRAVRAAYDPSGLMAANHPID